MKEMNIKFYRGGWIQKMKDIQNRKTTDLSIHTDEYVEGYNDASLHFDGLPPINYVIAYTCGIIDDYSEFYGQSDFSHPNP